MRLLSNLALAFALLAGGWNCVLAAALCPHPGCASESARADRRPDRPAATHARDELDTHRDGHATTAPAAAHAQRDAAHTPHDAGSTQRDAGSVRHDSAGASHLRAHGRDEAPRDKTASHCHGAPAVAEVRAGDNETAGDATDGKHDGDADGEAVAEVGAAVLSLGASRDASCDHCVGRPEPAGAAGFESKLEQPRREAADRAPHQTCRREAETPLFVREIVPSSGAPPGRHSPHLLFKVFRI
ncbi:MAG TPA: hypothetical protein VEY09_16710 [Pyrinomonadaceae bacterium]|nr:hypothetical protein [Pyrinomonadaceae bacterium]